MADSSVARSGRGFIYLLRFPNGKGYVGQTRGTVEARFLTHKNVALQGRGLLGSAWRKHGAPTIETIGEYSIEELNDREAQFIASFGTLVPNGYNLRCGGGVAHSVHPETLARRSASRKGKTTSLKGRPKSAETRARMSAAQRGKPHPWNKGKPKTAEHRARIAAALTGKPLSEERRAKISAALTGNAKLSAAFKGRPLTAETRVKISVALTGRHPTDETRMKMSIAGRARVARMKQLRSSDDAIPDALQLFPNAAMGGGEAD